MIVLIATFKAQAGCEQDLENAIKDMVEKVNQEEGTLAYTLHRAADDPGKFMLYEMYKDQAAFEFHGATDYFKEFGRSIRGYLAEKVKIEFYEDIAALKR